tara:strand:- start:2265 stop:2675 length:411 start_codon:yes stop_codon:yes gene_type:complete
MTDRLLCQIFNDALNIVNSKYTTNPQTRDYSFIKFDTSNNNLTQNNNISSQCYIKNLSTYNEKLLNKKNIIFNTKNNKNVNSIKLKKSEQYSIIANGYRLNGHKRATYASQNINFTNPNISNKSINGNIIQECDIR